MGRSKRHSCTAPSASAAGSTPLITRLSSNIIFARAKRSIPVRGERAISFQQPRPFIPRARSLIEPPPRNLDAIQTHSHIDSYSHLPAIYAKPKPSIQFEMSQDSGYDSTVKDDHVPDNVGPVIKTGKWPLRRRLQVFRKAISPDDKLRWMDWKVLWSSKIAEAAVGIGAQQSPVVMKILYLGYSADDARVFVVFQCDKNTAKRIQQFLKRQEVKGPTGSLEDYLFIPKPPTLLALDVKLRQNRRKETATMCGTTVTVERGGSSISTTIGGLIMMKTAQGNQLLGLTAAHALLSQYDERATREQPPVLQWKEDSVSIYDSDDHFFFDENDVDLDQGDLNSSRSSLIPTSPPTELMGPRRRSTDTDDPNSTDILVEQSISLKKPKTLKEALYLPSDFPENTKDSPFQGVNLDWALVKLDPKSYKPNQITDPPLELIAMSPRRTGLLPSEDVVAICGESGVLNGTMEHRHSAILIGPGNKFADAFDLQLATGQSTVDS